MYFAVRPLIIKKYYEIWRCYRDKKSAHKKIQIKSLYVLYFVYIHKQVKNRDDMEHKFALGEVIVNSSGDKGKHTKVMGLL